MKKILTVVLAAAILLCGAAMMKGGFEASAKISPTAATITVNPDATTVPTVPYTGTTTPGGSTTTPGSTTPGSSTVAPTKPITGTVTAAPTTPDGSTVTGTAKPDVNPDSPKTGDMSGAVFAFAGIALAGAAAAVVCGKKNKED